MIKYYSGSDEISQHVHSDKVYMRSKKNQATLFMQVKREKTTKPHAFRAVYTLETKERSKGCNPS